MKKSLFDRANPPAGFDPDNVTPPQLKSGPWRATALALDVSGRCNLACRYCAEAATQPRRQSMTIETLEAAWAFLYTDGKPQRGTSIRLGSGEPMLAFPLLQKLSHLIETRGEPKSRPTVFLTTNGTLLPEKVRDWLVTTGWQVKISLDGPEDIHNLWRVRPKGYGTYIQVAEAVTDLAHRIPERLSVTAVLCRHADPQVVFDAIAGLGVKRIELVPVAHHDESIKPDVKDVERYGDFVQSYARQYLKNTAGKPLPALVRFSNRVTRVMGYDNWRVPCGAGRSFYGVGPEGELYPCFRFIGIEAYRLGHVNTGLDAQATLKFQQGAGCCYELRTQCRECWAAALCGGPCFACAEMFGKGHGEPLNLHCGYALADARSAVWLVNQLRQRNPARLLDFLPVEYRV